LIMMRDMTSSALDILKKKTRFKITMAFDAAFSAW
jgi:hypothetical protein